MAEATENIDLLAGGSPEIRETQGSLADIPLFAGLGERELKRWAEKFKILRFPAGRRILDQGDLAEAFFIVKQGLVKVYRLNSNGRLVFLALLGMGDFFGEMALFEDSARTAWVEAFSEVSLYVMSKPHFKTLLREMPDVAWRMLQILSQRLKTMDDLLEGRFFLKVDQRLKLALANLAAKSGTSSGGRPVLPPVFTHEELGEMIGASRETVTRALNRMRKNGEIAVDGNCLILNYV